MQFIVANILYIHSWKWQFLPSPISSVCSSCQAVAVCLWLFTSSVRRRKFITWSENNSIVGVSEIRTGETAACLTTLWCWYFWVSTIMLKYANHNIPNYWTQTHIYTPLSILILRLPSITRQLYYSYNYSYIIIIIMTILNWPARMYNVLLSFVKVKPGACAASSRLCNSV